MAKILPTAMARALQYIKRISLFLDINRPASTEVDVTALIRFIDELSHISAPRVLELGSCRQEGQPSTISLHRTWVPHAAQYIGVDYQAGEDVDLVADIHELSKSFPRDSFDAVICCSTFEHIRYPWIAAVEIAKVLKIGGCLLVQTHQTFPLHSHPHDYWRFSTDGLETLFSPPLGLSILSCHYQYPCQIVIPRDPTPTRSYLNVCLVAKKVGPTPEVFLPDFTRVKSLANSPEKAQAHEETV